MVENIKTLIIIVWIFFRFVSFFPLFLLHFDVSTSEYSIHSFIVHLSYCFVTKNMCGSRTSRLVDVNVHVLFVNDGTDLTLLDFPKLQLFLRSSFNFLFVVSFLVFSKPIWKESFAFSFTYHK